MHPSVSRTVWSDLDEGLRVRVHRTVTNSPDGVECLGLLARCGRDHDDASAAPITRQLALLGIRPRIAVRVKSYLAVPYFVAGTDRIALMQERLAAKYADRLGLRVECPAELEPIVEALWWHEYYEDDPAHVWLRRLLTRAASADDPTCGEAGPGYVVPGRAVRTQELSTMFM